MAAGLSAQSTPEEVDALLHAVTKSGLKPVARDLISNCSGPVFGAI